MIEYRSAAFALFGSSVMQFSLLACLGIWCGWRPYETPQPIPSAVVLDLSRPAPKPVFAGHSVVSSNFRAASAKAAQLMEKIDNYIHPILEKSRTVRQTGKAPPPRSASPSPPRKPVTPKPAVRKPIREGIRKPDQKTIMLPLPAVTPPLDATPREELVSHSLSDWLAGIRQRQLPGGSSARKHTPGTGTTKGSDSGSSKPVSGNEISAYLNLVRRRLEESKIYPASARRGGLSGTVMLKFCIEADGSATGTAAEGTAPNELRDAALALIRNRRFPAPPKGWNARARIEIPVKYTLKETGFR